MILIGNYEINRYLNKINFITGVYAQAFYTNEIILEDLICCAAEEGIIKIIDWDNLIVEVV